MIELDLPFPPSTNTLFRNAEKGKRPKTKRYLAWISEASKEVMIQRQQPIKGEIDLLIGLGRPDKRKRDISNYIKAPEDLLVNMGLIEDDSCVQRMTVHWSLRTEAGRVHVVVNKTPDLC